MGGRSSRSCTTHSRKRAEGALNTRRTVIPLVIVVCDDYHVTMERKSGVAELKARLSEYLRAVKKGREVTIYDRDQPIARIVPYSARRALAVREPLTSYSTLGGIPLPPPAKLTVDPVELLLEDRQSDR